MIKSIINWVRGSAPAPCNQAGETGDPGWHRAPSIFSSPGSPLTHPPRESILQRQHRHAVNVLRRFAKYTEVLYSGEWETGIRVWYPNLVLELFSRTKSSSLEIFQLEKLQNIEGMIFERNGVDFWNEDDQIS